MNFDGTRFNVSSYLPVATTTVNGHLTMLPVDCSSQNTNVASVLTQSVGFPTQVMSDNYQEYRYNSVKVKWLPFISPGQAGGGSRVTLCYVDNPEQFASYVTAGTYAVMLPIVKAVRNCVSWNAWESKTINIPLTWRRKKFDVNSTNTYVVDSSDRSVQGLIMAVIEGINATEALGQFHVEYDVTVTGLSLEGTT